MADQSKLLNRLARIEGQVRGVARMVEEGRYCIDVLTQRDRETRHRGSVRTAGGHHHF